MKEINELINRYQENLKKAEENLEICINSFPYLDFSQDIFSQFNLELLSFFENILNKLSLSKLELEEIEEVFTYYKLNQDLDLTKLIIRDTKYLKFVDVIDKLYIKTLKYKETLRSDYQREIENCRSYIKPLDSIKGLFQSSSEIDINNLNKLLESLSFAEDLKSSILSQALNHNLAIYETMNQEKINQENLEEVSSDNIVDKLEENIEFDIEINEKTIDSYLRKINYLLSILATKQNKQEEDYLTQASLVKLQGELNSLIELNKELINSMDLNHTEEENIYLQATSEEIKIEFKKIVSKINSIEDEMFIEEDIEELEELEVLDGKERNLIFLNSSFKDIENFKKDVCQINIIKKVYSMLKYLKNYEIPPKLVETYINTSSPYQINEYRLKTNGKGAPTIFYQLVNNHVIILLMSIRGKHSQTLLKNTIQSRVNNTFETEYVMLTNALKLSTSKPNETSIYDKTLTNKEYMNELLLKYQEREQEFFEKFHRECYNPDEKMR